MLSEEKIKELWENRPNNEPFERYRSNARAIEAAVLEEQAKAEPVVIEAPEYHYEGMGCGLEDRGITDRYEAMQHGWNCAVERMFEQIGEEPLYLHPAPAPEGRVLVPMITDTERLTWMLQHGGAEFDRRGGEHYVIFWLGASTAPDRVSGKHIAKGASPHECIDNALRGNFTRVDG